MVSPGFRSLPARPPTPPKDIEQGLDDALAFLDTGFDFTPCSTSTKRAVSAVPTLSTPPERSPSNSQLVAKGIKRVDFSPHTEYHSPEWPGTTKSSLKPLPPKHSRALRSILKAVHYTQPSASQLCSDQQFDTFDEMLESVVQQLAAELRPARLDAYMTLLGVLQAYEDVPDPKALRAKLPLFTQFIQRDTSFGDSEPTISDIKITAQALKLLSVFLRVPSTADGLGTSFLGSAVERSTTALESSNLPKEIVTHHLQLLSQPRLHDRAITVERADRLLRALSDLDTRSKGKAVTISRIVIYQQCVDRFPHLMASRTSLWLEHLFNGMLSSVEMTQDRAIELGIRAGVSLGNLPQPCKAVVGLLKRQTAEGTDYASYLVDRLTKTMSIDGHRTPRIWSVVILFLRSMRRDIHTWKHYKLWLTLIQRCFNSGDLKIKSQALKAWNRLVYVVDLDSFTPHETIARLRQPIAVHLSRSNATKSIAISSYCNLLYYAFRPTHSHAEIEVFWNEYVEDIVPAMVSRSRTDAISACRILTALLGGPCRTVWNENKANERKQLQPEDLASIDAKWIRRNVGKILDLVTVCLNASWSPLSSDGPPAVVQLWSTFMGSVADAGSQEIKASMELKEAITRIVNHLHQLLAAYPSSLGTGEEQGTKWLSRFAFLIRCTVEKLGPRTFMDDILMLRDRGSLFEPAPTPSRRSHMTGILTSPLLHVCGLLVRAAAVHVEKAEFPADHFLEILSCCLGQIESASAKLKLLRACADDAASVTKLSAWPTRVGPFWSAIQQQTKSIVKNMTPKTKTSPFFRSFDDFQAPFDVLQFGMLYGGPHALQSFFELYRQLAVAIEQDAGNGSVVCTTLLLTEPLAAALSHHNIDHTRSRLAFAAEILSLAVPSDSYQTHRQASGILAAYLRRNVSSRFTAIDFHRDLIQMTRQLSQQAYSSLDSTGCVFVLGLRDFVRECHPPEFAAQFFRRLQEPLSVWLQNNGNPISIRNRPDRNRDNAIADIFELLLEVLESSRENTATLETFGTLISGCLMSTYANIASGMSRFLALHFSPTPFLTYPDVILKAMDVHKASRTSQRGKVSIPDYGGSVLPGLQDVHQAVPTSTEEISLPIERPVSEHPPIDPNVRPLVDELAPKASSKIGSPPPGCSSLETRTDAVAHRPQNTAIAFADIRSDPLENGDDAESEEEDADLEKPSELDSFMTCSLDIRSFETGQMPLSDDTEPATTPAARSAQLEETVGDPPSSPPQIEEEDTEVVDITLQAVLDPVKDRNHNEADGLPQPQVNPQFKHRSDAEEQNYSGPTQEDSRQEDDSGGALGTSSQLPSWPMNDILEAPSEHEEEQTNAERIVHYDPHHMQDTAPQQSSLSCEYGQIVEFSKSPSHSDRSSDAEMFDTEFHEATSEASPGDVPEDSFLCTPTELRNLPNDLFSKIDQECEEPQIQSSEGKAEGQPASLPASDGQGDVSAVSDSFAHVEDEEPPFVEAEPQNDLATEEEHVEEDAQPEKPNGLDAERGITVITDSFDRASNDAIQDGNSPSQSEEAMDLGAQVGGIANTGKGLPDTSELALPSVVSDSFVQQSDEDALQHECRSYSQERQKLGREPDVNSRKRKRSPMSRPKPPVRQTRAWTSSSATPFNIEDDDGRPLLDCIVVATSDSHARASKRGRGSPVASSTASAVLRSSPRLSTTAQAKNIPIPSPSNKRKRTVEVTRSPPPVNAISRESSKHSDYFTAASEPPRKRRSQPPGRKGSQVPQSTPHKAVLSHVEIPRSGSSAGSSANARRRGPHPLSQVSVACEEGDTEVIEGSFPWPKSSRGPAEEIPSAQEPFVGDRTLAMKTLRHGVDDFTNAIDVADATEVADAVHTPSPKANPSTPMVSPTPAAVTPLAPEAIQDRPPQPETPSVRRILTPRSIIGRLRGILDGCRQMVGLGSQEEREFDDVLREVQHEVREAKRRSIDET